MALEKIKSELEEVAAKFMKVAAWGFLIIGGMLILEKVLGFGWEFSLSLGL